MDRRSRITIHPQPIRCFAADIVGLEKFLAELMG